MQSASGEAAGILLLGANITKRKLMQSQLAQAQKLESIGQLAAGIAHEINTPIQYIGDNMLFLQESFHDLSTLLEHYAALYQMCRDGAPMASVLGQIETTTAAIDVAYLTAEIPTAIQQSLEGVERVATIVRAMKEFSHPGTKEKVSVDLNKAIESTITVARNEWKYVAQMVTDLAPDLPLVPCVPGELNQVILNILVNAAHALGDGGGDGAPEKGTITVSTRQGGDGVEIRIADTGPGIPEAIRDKIFDPFFTTKEVGKGTGQGLAIAHTVVVEQHGGQLTFETAEGEGTTFIIRLPLTLSGS
jgi:signal transduction histidine kinase